MTNAFSVLRRLAGRRLVRRALRVLVAAAACWLAVVAAGWQPASAAVITGVLTWLVLHGPATWQRVCPRPADTALRYAAAGEDARDGLPASESAAADVEREPSSPPMT